MPGPWLIATFLIALTVAILVAVVRSARRGRPGHPACGACGYDVRGLASRVGDARCPECGARLLEVGIIPGVPVGPPRRRGPIVAAVVLAGLALLLLVTASTLSARAAASRAAAARAAVAQQAEALRRAEARARMLRRFDELERDAADPIVAPPAIDDAAEDEPDAANEDDTDAPPPS